MPQLLSHTISNIYEDLVISFNYNYRLAKPLDGKGDEDETIEDQEEVYKGHLSPIFVSLPQADETADDMREADETDDDEVTTEIEDNQNEVDSESWEGLSAENEEEEGSLNQDEVIKEEEEVVKEEEEVVKEEVEVVNEEEEVIKEPEAPARVPELIFQDGQWVEAGEA